MSGIILLVVAHHIADVWAQPSWLIKNKQKHWWSVYEHVWIYAGIISAGLWYLGLFEWWKFWFLLTGHFVIDYIRYRYFYFWNSVYVDQALHYLQLATVYFI